METKCNDSDCVFPKCDCWKTKRRFSQSRVVKLEKVAEAADKLVNFQGPDIHREVEKREALKEALTELKDEENG